MPKKFRLYIDESGTHNYSLSDDPARRYLGLTGVIISEKTNAEMLQPTLIKIKRLIADDSDELPVLHRDDIVNQRGVFTKLNNDEVKREFNKSFISLFKDLDYTICAIVLDKKTHAEKHQQTAYHPYHYCLNILLERYTFCLEENNAIGDVIAETRGEREDLALKEAYKNFYESGTYYRHPYNIQKFLTSKELKIKGKEKMIAGLEFADLLTLATKLDILQSYGRFPALRENFLKTVVDNIQSKYRCSAEGAVKGFGKKLIG